VQPDQWVVNVPQLGGHNPYSSFALVTPEIEADLGYGAADLDYGTHHRMIDAIDLFGIDDQGAIKFQGGDRI
jgi:hypothetical protein